jgi:hypothetical protein
MGFKHMFKAVAPMVALAIAGSLAGCENANVNFNGEEGKQLADLDLSGEAPSEVSLLGPDTVDIRDGEKLAIRVEGSDEAKERMRFVLKEGSLGILRRNGTWNDNQVATVIVTMPAPAKLNLAGSGRMTAASVSDHPEVNVAGSGDATFASDGEVEANIMGSGDVTVKGRARCKVHAIGSGSLVCEGGSEETGKAD